MQTERKGGVQDDSKHDRNRKDKQVFRQQDFIRGFFFGYKRKKEELKYFSLGDDGDYELIGKGDCKVEKQNQKTELLRKAQELIDKAQELKNEANKL